MKYEFGYDLLPKVKSGRRTGSKMTRVGFLVAHDVGNDGLDKKTGRKLGTTARGNISYYRSTPLVLASAHIFVDWKEILICVPLDEKAWHVLYNITKDNQMYGDDSNDIAIGVELCYYPEDKQKTLQAYDRYIWTLAYLCYTYKLNPLRHITGHHILDPGRKSDPLNSLKYLGKNFNDLLNDVKNIYEQCTRTVIPPNPTKLMWGKTELKKGQIGKITVIRPINLWTDNEKGKLVHSRTLLPDEEYRVYGYREEHGGQYNVGGGMWVTKMPEHIYYQTPSKAMLEKLNTKY